MTEYTKIGTPYYIDKGCQLRSGWMNTPEGRIIRVCSNGINKCVLVLDNGYDSETGKYSENYQVQDVSVDWQPGR